MHELEDIMGLIAHIDNHRQVIKRQAWREGSWKAVYMESVDMQGDLELLRLWMSNLWSKWIAEAETPA